MPEAGDRVKYSSVSESGGNGKMIFRKKNVATKRISTHRKPSERKSLL